MTGHPITSDAHALLIGQVCGIAMRHGIELRPVLDGDLSFTAELLLIDADGLRISLIVPPPPDPFLEP